MSDNNLFEKIHCNILLDDQASSNERFNQLALELFEHQFTHNDVYQKFCKGLGVTAPMDWKEIPCLSSDSFKKYDLFCGDLSEAVKVFFSSGTSQRERSKHYLSGRQLKLYESSLWMSFARAFKLNERQKVHYLVLSESPIERPHSSLIHMFETIRLKIGKQSLEDTYCMSDGQLSVDKLNRALGEAYALNKPVLLLGTAFAFVQLLDSDHSKCRLVAGSAIMETGGFKGKSREISRDELYKALSEHFGLPMQNIIGQYGMSELGVQFYDFSYVFNSASSEARHKKVPGWARVRIINPSDPTKEAAIGEVGLICHYDLTNLDSCAFILSGDVGVKRSEYSFELIGRASQLSLKGCSLNYDPELHLFV